MQPHLCAKLAAIDVAVLKVNAAKQSRNTRLVRGGDPQIVPGVGRRGSRYQKGGEVLDTQILRAVEAVGFDEGLQLDLAAFIWHADLKLAGARFEDDRRSKRVAAGKCTQHFGPGAAERAVA